MVYSVTAEQLAEMKEICATYKHIYKWCEEELEGCHTSMRWCGFGQKHELPDDFEALIKAIETQEATV